MSEGNVLSILYAILTLENTEGAIKNGKSRETGNKTKKNKATTQNALDTTMYTQTYIT